jgi:hypothetical protein
MFAVQSGVVSYTDQTLKKLFALSGNVCAFPGCTAPIVDTDSGVVVGDICHIKGRSENGPRYDPNQTDEERNGYENLLLMCVAHNRIVDGKKTRDQYPVERLQEFKRNHETRYARSVVEDAARDEFLEHFSVAGSVITTYNQSGGQNAHTITNIYAGPPKPKASLTPIVTTRLTKVVHRADLDFYTIRIELRNDGTKTVREFAIEVEIPEAYMENAGSYSANLKPKRPGTKLFRHIQKNSGDFALYSGDSYTVFSLGFVLKKRHYLLGVRESVRISIYENDEPVSVTEHPMADMLNAERVERLLGPRLTAIRKICEIAWNRVGQDGNPTSETLFLSEEPIKEPTPQPRSVYIENAYNMGKTLEGAGWIAFESEDAMSIRLTDEGVLAGS